MMLSQHEAATLPRYAMIFRTAMLPLIAISHDTSRR